jgi:hypothetical protein
MKKIVIASLFGALLAGNVFAENVQVPFMHKSVPVEGLTVSYDTNGTQRVICITDNFYKGYLYITENGAEKDAGIAYGNYGHGDEFYFTSVGSTKLQDTVDQFHVDKYGIIKFQDTQYEPHKAFVSCFYVPEAVK